MLQYMEVLKKCSLFKDIDQNEMEGMMTCLGAVMRSYNKQSFIHMAGDTVSAVGVVLEGEIQVISEDVMGNRTILTSLSEGDLFGEAFACTGIKAIPVSVIAKKDSKVLFADYERIISTCPHSCPFHKKLINNMMYILATKNITLNQKIECLSKRSMRDKLLTFLMFQSSISGTRTFTIPYNRQEMADYLCADRSAMSAELSRMRNEGIIKFHKNQFELC